VCEHILLGAILLPEKKNHHRGRIASRASSDRSRNARHFPAIIEATEPLGAEIPHRLQFVGWH